MSTAIHSLINRQLQLAQCAIAYLTAERDLYQRFGPTADRHLDDDDRRRLARLELA